MLTLVAIAQAKPGKEKVLEDTLLELVALTRQEAGCINYDLHRSLGKPGKFVFYENWVDHAALDQHRKMPYIVDFQPKAVDLLEESVQIELYEMISDRVRI
ncbi:MAG: putative quinol monooxygenase [Desulfomonilaceae bacterium]